MRVGITGAAGYIGQRLALAAVELGHHVVAMDIAPRPPALDVPEIRWIQGSVADIEAVRHLAGERPDVAFDLAAVSAVTECARDPLRCMEVNASSRWSLCLELSLVRTLRGYLFPSTLGALHSGDHDTLGDATPPAPLSVYGVSKLAAEAIVRAHRLTRGLPAVIFRQANVYGPSPRPKPDTVIPSFIRQALRDGVIQVRGDGRQVRSFLHLDDLVGAYLCLIAAPAWPAGEVFCLGGESLTLVDLARRVADACERRYGRRPEVQVEDATAAGPAAHEARFRGVDTSRARRGLGWWPRVPLERGIERALDEIEEERMA